MILLASSQATFIAYLRQPLAKAFILSLPIPFSMAVLSIGRPIDATHVMGLSFFLLFNQFTRLLHSKAKAPIVLSIGIGACAYALGATWVASWLPRTETSFWAACGIAALTAIFFHWWLKPGDEVPYRTMLPVWIKFPMIASVIICIVQLKIYLQGFMAVFPMVSVVALYEARYCLRTICRQMDVLVFAMLPVMITMRLVQPLTGYQWALVPGWCVFLAIMLPWMRRAWRRRNPAG